MSLVSPKLHYMPNTKPNLIGLFAGVGGIELGFEKAGFEALLANEIDEYAGRTYVQNHTHPMFIGDIASLSKAKVAELLHVPQRDLPELQVLTGGFPCQPFSVAGYRKGFDDDRGNVFWEIHRLIRELKPEVVFLENVKNLRGHDEGRTFRTILSALQNEISDPFGALIGHRYHVATAVLNAKDFGVPQNRERIFIVAFRDQKALERFSFPTGTHRSVNSKLENFIDFESKKDPKYYYDQNRPFYEQLKAGVTKGKTVYQWRRQYVRENMSGLCPTLTANMGMGGHNVPIVKTRHGIRKLTPQECFGLMGMKNIKIPEGMSESRLYKQAGNAVVVPVIEAIARRIKTAISR
jgi:DNA (cytosine-5)-methyltransferase 1